MVTVGVALDDERDARAAGAIRELRHDGLELGSHRNRPERDDPGAGLELGEEQDLVDQLADLLDLDARLLDELRDVLPR